MATTDDETLESILDRSTIAVIGCSTTSGKAAHEVPAYLQRHGYGIVPINPFADEILGEPAFDALGDVPADAGIDVVNVFRPSEEVAGIVDDALDRHAAVGDADVLWLQLGIHDDEAEARARDAGLTVVSDRCMKIEHGRLRR